MQCWPSNNHIVVSPRGEDAGVDGPDKEDEVDGPKEGDLPDEGVNADHGVDGGGECGSLRQEAEQEEEVRDSANEAK